MASFILHPSGKPTEGGTRCLLMTDYSALTTLSVIASAADHGSTISRAVLFRPALSSSLEKACELWPDQPIKGAGAGRRNRDHVVAADGCGDLGSRPPNRRTRGEGSRLQVK